MNEFTRVKKGDDVFYRIKDYTADDFSESVMDVIYWFDWKSSKTLEEIAEEIGEYFFNEKPCDIRGWECKVDFLHNEKIYSFVITGEASVEYFARLVEEEVKEN